MKKITLLALLIGFLIPSLSSGQLSLDQGDDQIQPADWRDFLNGVSYFVNKDPEGLLNSEAMYLFPEWREGMVIDKNGRILAGQMLKYRSYDDEMLLKTEAETRRLYPLMIDKVVIDGRTFRHYKFYKEFETEKITLGFMEILQDGPVQLLMRRETYFVEGSYSSISVPGINRKTSNDKRYIIKQQLYILNHGEDVAHRLKKGKKTFAKLLPENYGKVKDFASKKGLKFNVEEDLIELVQYHNQLKVIQM